MMTDSIEHSPNTSTTRVPIQKRESSKTAEKLLTNAGGDESKAWGVCELLTDSKMKASLQISSGIVDRRNN